MGVVVILAASCGKSGSASHDAGFDAGDALAPPDAPVCASRQPFAGQEALPAGFEIVYTPSSSMLVAPSLASNGQVLVWAQVNADKMVALDPTGCGSRVLLDQAHDDVRSVVALVADDKNAYFSQWSPIGIWKVPLDGSAAPTQIFGGTDWDVGGLAVSAGVVYFSASKDFDSMVMGLPVDGGDPFVLARHVKVNMLTARKGYVYFQCTPLDMTNPVMARLSTAARDTDPDAGPVDPTMFPSTLPASVEVLVPQTQTMDDTPAVDDDSLYWQESGILKRVPLAGGTVSNVANINKVGFPSIIVEFAPANDVVYWAEPSAGCNELHASAPDGSNPRLVLPCKVGISSPQILGQRIYFTSNGGQVISAPL